jgi:DNA-binding NtrC family response regulator
VRVIAATNQNLMEQINNGLFRKDLYYRLDVIHIKVPPLREHRSDIPLLVEHILRKQSGGNIPCSISKDAMNALISYDWPGNVRELENIVSKLLLYKEGPNIRLEDVISVIDRPLSYIAPFDELSLAEVEAAVIGKALKKYDQTVEGKKKAAQQLGISLSCLYDKIKKYCLETGV